MLCVALPYIEIDSLCIVKHVSLEALPRFFVRQSVQKPFIESMFPRPLWMVLVLLLVCQGFQWAAKKFLQGKCWGLGSPFGIAMVKVLMAKFPDDLLILMLKK